jgi:NCS1 family nucleobase:cation symporter-1
LSRSKTSGPALYDPRGRYSYWYGINWRALLLAFLVAIVPTLSGLADSIKTSGGDGHEPGLSITQGIKNIYTFDSLFGFVVSISMYISASLLFLARGNFGRDDDIWP